MMRKLLVFFVLGAIMCSCASYKLEKTVWSTVHGAENNGERGSVITSLYFLTDNKVDVYKSVVVDTSIVVSPFKYAECKYVVKGNPKKEAEIRIDGKSLDKEKFGYNGVYRKRDGMYLISKDSIPSIYTWQKSIVLP